MSTKFIVEGRVFDKHNEAVAFAEALAEKMDRAVRIDAELSQPITTVDRRWVATMHPPGTQRPISQSSAQRMVAKIRAAQ